MFNGKNARRARGFVTGHSPKKDVLALYQYPLLKPGKIPPCFWLISLEMRAERQIPSEPPIWPKVWKSAPATEWSSLLLSA
jgi:hypothetical protein